MTQIYSNICNKCMHKHDFEQTCDAFPEGIPADIYMNRVIHNKPYPGDHGIMYEGIIPIETLLEERAKR